MVRRGFAPIYVNLQFNRLIWELLSLEMYLRAEYDTESLGVFGDC